MKLRQRWYHGGRLRRRDQDLLRALHHNHPQIRVSFSGDVQLLFALPGVTSARLQSCVAARISTLTEAARVFIHFGGRLERQFEVQAARFFGALIGAPVANGPYS